MSETGENPSVREWGEEALVSHLLAGLSSAPGVLTGPGDDCAVLESDSKSGDLLLFKTDSVVEGVHFEEGTDAERVGRKALCRAISDMAAMGGRPTFALVTLAVDDERAVSEVAGWYRGIQEAADSFGCAVVGGETTRLPARGALLSVAMLGKVDRNACLLRSGGKVGDFVAVTGRLGGSFASGRHLTFSPRVEEGQWLAKSGSVTAMMDLSDGVGSDLPRLAKSSEVGYAIDLESLPCHDGVPVERAITDGEDYELLLTVSPGAWGCLAEDWGARFPDCELTKIGELTESTDRSLPSGWEHYRNRE